MILRAVLLGVLLFSTKAIVNHNPSKPGCPAHVSPLDSFTPDLFSGVWYPIQKYQLQFEVGKCITINVGFLRGTNTTSVTMEHSQRIGGNYTVFEQNATVHNAISSIWTFKYNMSLSGEFKLHLSSLMTSSCLLLVDVDGFIYILDTNYLNYAVAFACGLINKRQNGQMLWILSRTRSLQQGFLDQAMAALNRSSIQTRSLVASDQTNCSSGFEGL